MEGTGIFFHRVGNSFPPAVLAFPATQHHGRALQALLALSGSRQCPCRAALGSCGLFTFLSPPAPTASAVPSRPWPGLYAFLGVAPFQDLSKAPAAAALDWKMPWSSPWLAVLGLLSSALVAGRSSILRRFDSRMSVFLCGNPLQCSSAAPTEHSTQHWGTGGRALPCSCCPH